MIIENNPTQPNPTQHNRRPTVNQRTLTKPNINTNTNEWHRSSPLVFQRHCTTTPIRFKLTGYWTRRDAPGHEISTNFKAPAGNETRRDVSKTKNKTRLGLWRRFSSLFYNTPIARRKHECMFCGSVWTSHACRRVLPPSSFLPPPSSLIPPPFLLHSSLILPDQIPNQISGVMENFGRRTEESNKEGGREGRRGGTEQRQEAAVAVAEAGVAEARGSTEGRSDKEEEPGPGEGEVKGRGSGTEHRVRGSTEEGVIIATGWRRKEGRAIEVTAGPGADDRTEGGLAGWRAGERREINNEEARRKLGHRDVSRQQGEEGGAIVRVIKRRTGRGRRRDIRHDMEEIKSVFDAGASTKERERRPGSEAKRGEEVTGQVDYANMARGVAHAPDLVA
ncbi:hypothetical protein B0H13DRAFT_1859573 [Mycena leptocephala]|nr:hypothetical protein B0H13DRAFT_1859573 [Mycena leptocephala]